MVRGALQQSVRVPRSRGWFLSSLRLTRDRHSFEWTLADHGQFKFGEEQEGSNTRYEFETFDFVDLVHIEGKTGRGVAKGGGINMIKLACFRGWSRPFPMSCSIRIDYDIQGCSLYMGSSGGMHWFLILKRIGHMAKEPKRGSEKSTIGDSDYAGTNVSVGRAAVLMRYFLSILGEEGFHALGVNEFNYKVGWQHDLSTTQFSEFQKEIARRWGDIESDDVFFESHVPTFHCILIGNNLSIGRMFFLGKSADFGRGRWR